jgi:hypothetical protein
MSEAQKGNKHSLGHRNNLGNHHTENWKARMSAANKGQVGNRLGMRATEETKEKQRVAMLAHWRGRERKNHCVNGHIFSEENCITYYWKQGRKKCRICANASGRRSHKNADRIPTNKADR